MTKRSEFIVKGEDFKKLTAAKVMEIDVISVNPESPCSEIAEILTKKNFGSVPVVDTDNENRLLGIVSEHDLLSAIIGGKDLKSTKAAEIMTQNPFVATWDMRAWEIADIMVKKDFIRIPIVVPGEKGENLVGIVARRDIIFSYLQSIGHQSPDGE